MRIVSLSFALAPLLAAASLSAQTAPFSPGRVVERVVARSDSSQSYAAYLPSGYEAGRRWPVLFLMDPRGRAGVPLGCFRGAAERHGWVVLSSYNTASDVEDAVQRAERALDAMLGDAQDMLSVDTRRLYLGGFSGTARVAWALGFRLRDHVAGIVGFGAGLPGPGMLALATAGGDAPFAFFGGAGTGDFNHLELRSLAARLERSPLPHRVEFYPGGHAWPPEPVCREAVEWMELQALREGTRPRDPAWADSLYAARLEAARALEAAGRTHDAWVRYRAAAADFAGVRDAAEARGRSAALGARAEVRRTEARAARLDAADSAYERGIGDFLRAHAAARTPPPLAAALRELRVADLRREAADSADTLASASARRRLEQLFVNTAFYGPREHFRRGDPARALGLLRIAAELRPGHPEVCWGLARALAQTGEHAGALDALECAARSGVLAASLVEGEPLLEPLRAEPRYRAVVERLRTSPPGSL